VTWFVLKGEAQMSNPQFHAFQNILGNDFRPLQNANHRAVYATPKAARAEHTSVRAGPIGHRGYVRQVTT
jgi:hypothetical protein